MRFCIRQKVFSFGDKFAITDENGKELFYGVGEVFAFGKKLHIYDIYNNEVAYIEQKLFHFRTRFNISVKGRDWAELVKEITFFGQRYTVEGTDWNVEGSIMMHEYEIKSSHGNIARIYKEWFTWGDCYVLDVFNPADDIYALAVMLGIDCAVDVNS